MNARAERTLHHIRILRSLGPVRPLRKRLPRQQPPTAIEAEYAREIRNLLQFTYDAFGSLFQELPSLLEATRSQLARMDIAEGKRARELIERSRDRVRRERLNENSLERAAEERGREVARFQKQQIERQVKAGLGADVGLNDRRLPDRVSHWASENAALVKDVPETFMNDLSKSVTRAVASGQRWEDLSKEIQQKYGIAENRANLIARDQIGKLYARINQDRQRELGIEQYTWRTVNDERVRPEHAALEGDRFRWDDPPGEGHPGSAVQCRCSAEPFMDELTLALRGPAQSAEDETED